MSDGSRFDADYFLRGRETGKSLYEDYRWLPDLTIPMCKRIVEYCGIAKGDTILDFGCARGYVVRALRELGYSAYGYDVSEWAVGNADKKAKPYLTTNRQNTFREPYHWIIAKDVLEHIEYVSQTVDSLLALSLKGMFAVVPLSMFDGSCPYVIEEYEKDVTHCQRWSLAGWGKMFMRPDWRVELAYRVPGIKDNYASYTYGNGFITARRIEQCG